MCKFHPFMLPLNTHQHLFHMHGSACAQQLRPACTNSDKPSLCWLLSSSYASQADCERRSINKLICGDNYSPSPSQHLLSTRWKQQGTINPQQPICKCKISQKHVNVCLFWLRAHGPNDANMLCSVFIYLYNYFFQLTASVNE